MTNYANQIATHLAVPEAQVQAAIDLFDEGNTLPFVARYRKERTGGLDEEQLRYIQTTLVHGRALDERRATIIAAIESQGKLTPELHEYLLAATTKTELEDLYQPYKQKRRTRASIARERGLQPLADLIVQQARTPQSVEALAAQYCSADVPTADDALHGARDIVAETISDHPAVRGRTREQALRWAVLRSERRDDAEDARGVYQTYYEFEGLINRLRPYQVLALNRGEADNVLRVRVDVPERDWRSAIGAEFRVDQRSPFATHLQQAIDDAAQRLLLPAIERDVRRTMTEAAETHAIEVFGANLRALLAQPPIAGNAIIGIDPGFRTGSKIAVVGPTGNVLDTATIYPHESQRQREAALHTLQTLVERHHATLVAIGNGTASRETEQLVASLIERVPSVRYLIVNEAGASVYSASPLARAELPDLDVSIRGAVSIARRVQDPLAELVKIEPKAIGVGMYQHDVDQTQLATALNDVVESVVNHVGVDVNTASPALLTYVAGIGPKLAQRIVEYRDEHGAFRNRTALKKVSGLGPKSFEQAAGFLRVRGGDQPLDATAIHPESYALARSMLQRARVATNQPASEQQQRLKALRRDQPISALAAELGAGEPTLADIFEQLLRPGRDPREDLPPPILRSDVLSLDDVQVGMRLNGTVRNVVDFGAFIDIGVKQDGLLHRSQIPAGVHLSVGDIIEVEIKSVDAERGRIGLGL